MVTATLGNKLIHRDVARLRAVIALGAILALTIGVERSAAAHQPPVRVVKPDGPNGPIYGCFGKSVLLTGSFAFVGDPCENTPTQSGIGAVYRLRRYGAGWVVDQRFGSTNPAFNGHFGWSLAIHHAFLAVGAPGEQSGGLVYQFGDVFNNTSPAAAETFGPLFPSPNAAFGTSVAAYWDFSGTQFLAGAPYGVCSSNISGGFAEPLTVFNEYVCTPASSTQAEFGAAIVVRGNIALIGAPGTDVTFPTTVGSGYLYNMGALGVNPPTVVSLFVPSDPNKGRRFGTSLDMNDTTVVFGAPMGAASGQVGNGDVWIYGGKIPNWGVEAVLEEPGASPTRAFGTSVALSGATLWVGSPETAGGGALYEYTNSPSGWIIADTVGADPADTIGNLGASLGLDGPTWIAGAPAANAYQANFWTGGVYISADDFLFESDFDR